MSTGAFHEGLREAMASPSEVAVLRERSAAEQKVVAEHDRRPFNAAVTVCAGVEIKMLAGMARDSEAAGDRPMLAWYRDDNGIICGVTLLSHVAREKHSWVDVGQVGEP